MELKFKQGIVQAPPGFVGVLGADVRLQVWPGGVHLILNVCNGPYTFLFNETKNEVAWFNVPSVCWLYWDFNVRTGQVTYDCTEVSPSYGPTVPSTPVDDQHWFDTSDQKMKVWVASRQQWVHVLRVFAAHRNGSNLSPVTGSSSFIGSQVGLSNLASYMSGFLAYGDDGTAIRKGNGSFFTTTDVVATNISSSSSVRFDSIVTNAIAAEPITQFTVCVLFGMGQLRPAFTATLNEVYTIVERDVDTGDIVTVSIGGLVFNPNWNWSANAVGQLLTIHDGALTTTSGGPPVARVINAHTVEFLSPSISTPTTSSPQQSYTHFQPTPSTTWTIFHQLNKYPSTVIIDSSTNQRILGSESFPSLTTAVITFTRPISGVATLT
jgi:hypothetical protein